MPAATPIGERFWTKVNKAGRIACAELGPCWEWTASIGSHGYGQICYKAAPRHAHRVSWELTNGPIPRGLCVLHRCDNPPCVNPFHLFLGTYADNTRDMMTKGRCRAAPPRGARNPSAKLTENDVIDIRSLRTMGARTVDIAKGFEISLTNAKDIIGRRIWSHVA